MKKEVVILAHGGVCKNVIDAIDDTKYHISEICDDNYTADFGNDYKNIKCFRSINQFINASNKDILFFNCIGNIKYYKNRIRYSTLLRQKGCTSINIFHKNSYISNTAIFGNGNVVLSGSIFGPDVIIGNDCIVFSNCVIEHDCCIGDNCYFSPSSTLCGKVKLGNNVYVGPGVIVGAGVHIGDNVILGAGSVVLTDVSSNTVEYGIPSRFVKYNDLWNS